VGRVAGADPAAGDVASIRVLVVDDHRSFGETLGLAIDMQPDLECVGICETAAEAIEMAAATHPDVVILDVRLPDADGIDATHALRQACPGTPILIVTAYSDLELLSRAAAAGVSGLLPKESPVAEFFAAIRSARTSGMIIDRSVLGELLHRAQTDEGSRKAGIDTHLTPRETGVLSLMGEGMDTQSISRQLGIRVSTCRGYQKSILLKLGAHSQLEAVVVASRRGLIPALSA
jgi:DNA-binding NarL/FixJ family response regulator